MIFPGLQKQGLHCIKCRKDFHKTCAFQVNVTTCSEEIVFTDINHLDSSVFGVPLKEQVFFIIISY